MWLDYLSCLGCYVCHFWGSVVDLDSRVITDGRHAQVSGVAEGVFSFGASGEERPQILARLEAAAVEKAVLSGADPSRCQVPWDLPHKLDSEELAGQ